MAKPSLLAPPTSNSVNPSLIGVVSPAPPAAAPAPVASVRDAPPATLDWGRVVVLVVAAPAAALPATCDAPLVAAPEAATVVAVVDVAAALATAPEASTMGPDAVASDDEGGLGPCTSMGTTRPASSIPTMTSLSV